MGLKLNSVFEFLPASATAFSETALSNPNQVDVGTLVTLSAASPDSKYVLVPDESMDLELKTARAIFNRQGQVLIPEGSIIKGRVEPTEINGNEGAQFIANTLILGTQSYSINAASPSITAVSMKSLNAADFHGNVIASPGASETIRGVGGASQSTSGGGFLGIGNLLGGSGSKKKIILLNPNTLQLEFTAPLTVNNFGS